MSTARHVDAGLLVRAPDLQPVQAASHQARVAAAEGRPAVDPDAVSAATCRPDGLWLDADVHRFDAEQCYASIVWIDVREGPIEPAEVLEHTRQPSAGGIDVFIGVVRDHNDGRPVVLLEYQVYRSMAMAEMERIAREIEERMPGVCVAAAHRVGPLKVGDIAVVCAASAPHRGEAFEACRALIDEIKHRVPIWKREHGPEGAYWVGWIDARCTH